MANLLDILFPGAKYVKSTIQKAAPREGLTALAKTVTEPVKYASSIIKGSVASNPLVNPPGNQLLSFLYNAGKTPTPVTTPTTTTTKDTGVVAPQDEWEDIGSAGKDIGGGGGGGGGGEGVAGGTDLTSLIGRLAEPSDAYAKAYQAEEAMLPLIQQRYKALLDELELSEQKQTTAQKTAEETQIGETRARASAAGTFAGTTELGTEDIIRKSTADAIAVIQQTGDIQRGKAIIQQGIDEANVAKEIARLGISEDEAQRSGLKDAISAYLEATKGTVVETAGGVKLVNPYTGGVIANLGMPFSSASTVNLGTLATKISQEIESSPVLNKTGNAKAWTVYARLQSPLKGVAMNEEDSEYKKLQGDFFALQQATIKAIQGTRPSDYDAISYAQNVSLTITNSPAANRVAIDQLTYLLQGGDVSALVQ